MAAALISVVAFACSIATAQARAEPGLPALHAVPDPDAGGRIVDQRGRQVILRGVNVNALAHYWKGTRFPTTFPLERKDPRRIRNFGWNAVRLLISWSRVEPAPGSYDNKYLARVKRMAARLTGKGLYVIIDFHQDAWGPTLAAREGEVCPAGSTPALGWDGAPGWATLVAEDVSRCAPGVRELSPAARAAWGAFWTDRSGPDGVGIQTHFLRALSHTVKRIGDQPGIAGYDVLNEPNAFGESENNALGAMYGRAVPRIRAAERKADSERRLIFFEPSVLWSATAKGAPPDFRHDLDVVYAPHLYTGAFDGGPITATTFESALDEARGFGGVPVLTGEWGADPSRTDYFASHLDLQDETGISSTQWSWRESCGDPHQRAAALAGSVATTWAIWSVDCADNRVLGIPRALRRTLMRGFVRVAPGRLRSVDWDSAERKLVATGRRARRGLRLKAYFPAKARVRVRGLTDLSRKKLGRGQLIRGVARGGSWKLRVTAR